MDSCKDAYGLHIKSKWVPTAQHAEDTAWSKALLKKIVKGETIPQVMTISGPTLFSRSAETRSYPMLLPKAEMQVEVKKERRAAFSTILKRSHGTTIDLCTPSPKKPRSSEATSAVSGASSSTGPAPTKLSANAFDKEDDDFDLERALDEEMEYQAAMAEEKSVEVE